MPQFQQESGDRRPGPARPRRKKLSVPGLIWPVLLALIVFAASLHFREIGAQIGWSTPPDWFEKLLRSLFWLVAAFAAQRWIRVLLWYRVVEARTGVEAPGLLVDLTGALVYLAAIIVTLSFVFDLSVTGLLTTSSIVIAVIGFALRNMISDLFTGIALGVERPFQIGDWVELSDGIVGRVIAMNWRATRLLTKEEVTIVISNSELAADHFKNYSAPERYFRDEITIILDYSVTAWRAERLLLSAVWSVPEISNVPRQPEIRIKEFHEHGTEWRIRFWIPDFNDLHRLRYDVQRNILRNIHFSGVQVPGKKVEWRNLPDATPQNDIDFLHEIDLLSPLTEAEIELINDQMTRRLFKRDEPVVRQGEDGASLFVVKEGMLVVLVAGDDNRQMRVGTLTPGSFFGEMSLLTGAPRGATVTPEVDSIGFEITKETLGPILKSRPELAERLSITLAERQLRTREAFAASGAKTSKHHRASLASELLSGIQKFFSL